MADKKKSILEEAILDATKIQEALKANTKDLLRSVSREEIDEIVNESLELEEADYIEEDIVSENGEEEEDEMSDDSEAGEEGDEFEDEAGEEGSEDYEDTESDIEIEPEAGEELPMDGGVSDDEEVMDMTGASDEDVISVYKKLSGEDEIEVVGDEITLTVSEPGEYVIKTDGGTPEAEIEAEPEMGGDEFGGEEFGDEEFGDEEMEDEVVYEIALDEDIIRTATSDIQKSMTGDMESGDIDNVTAPEGNENDDNWAGDNLEGGFPEDEATKGDGHAEHIMNEGNDPEDDDIDVDDEGDVVPDLWNEGEEITEEEINEDEVNEEDVAEGEEMDENLGHTRGAAGRQGARKVGAAHHPDAKKVNETEAKYKALMTEARKIKQQNSELAKALKVFKTNLAETAIFNTNLTHVTKLFMEHSTTKNEKHEILKRFDEEVTTIKESKRLYKSIQNELKNRTTIKEGVEKKIVNEANSSTSNLTESTAYVDASTQRMLDLMRRVEK